MKIIARIESEIEKEKEYGYRGLDYDIEFYSDTTRKRVKEYFENKNYEYIDWNTDDLYGKGVGRNMFGALNHNCISIRWN